MTVCNQPTVSVFLYICIIGDVQGRTYVAFRIDRHLRRRVVVFHILLANLAAVFDGFDSFTQAVLLYGSVVDGGLRDEYH